MSEIPAALARHTFLHYTDMSRLDQVRVIARGEGCHVFDDQGRRYIDGLSGLYCANLGHGYGKRLGEAAARQMGELGYSPNWSETHPRALELSERIAGLAPGDLNRVFFTSGGSESVEAAWKLARQFHVANGEPQRRKAIARRIAYHGVTLGALSFTGITSSRTPFEPMAIPTHHVSNTNPYRHPLRDDPDAFCKMLLAELEDAIEFEGPDTVAMLIAEPVQNAGGCLVPPDGYWQGLREICDRYGILLCADEVICAWGRLGSWFGVEQYGAVPDLLTFAKGVTAAYFAFGGVLISDRVAEPFMQGREHYQHGVTFGGHPVGCAIALEVIDILEQDGVLDNVRHNETVLRNELAALREIPIVGDVRGTGAFWALELVPDQESRGFFSDEDAEWLLGDVLSEHLADRGLLCRQDGRAEPALQIAPPLVADPELLREMVAILGESLQHASDVYARERAPAAAAG
jgi:hypothetical protein